MRMRTTTALAAVILATLFGGALAVDRGGTPTAEGRGKKQLCPWAERCVYVDERGKPLKRPICTKFCPRDCAACSND